MTLNGGTLPDFLCANKNIVRMNRKTERRKAEIGLRIRQISWDRDGGPALAAVEMETKEQNQGPFWIDVTS